MAAATISSTTQKYECFHCQKPLDKVLECARCHIAKYCGKECQIAAWKSCHKIECATHGFVSFVQSIASDVDKMHAGVKSFQKSSSYFAEMAKQKGQSLLEAKTKGLPTGDLEKEYKAYASIVSEHNFEGMALAKEAHQKIDGQQNQIKAELLKLLAILN